MADLFSDILKLANAQSVITGAFQAGGAWAFRFPAPDMIKFFGIVRGSCWLRVEGEAADLRLGPGDVFLLSAPRAFTLATSWELEPLDAVAVFRDCPGPVTRIGDGDDFQLLGGHVELGAGSGDLLTAVLPPMMVARAGSPHAAMCHWVLAQLAQERSGEQPGAAVASEQLAHLLFIHILRAHLAQTSQFPAGWLRAITDRDLAPALRLMHGEPGRAWQLTELAKAAGMSRTTFATRFRSAAGVPPLTYLTQWRMRLAKRALVEGDTPVSTLAFTLGYTSESAFSHAFKRTTGLAPNRVRGVARGLPGE
ncbi:AraC family transcriptional regulator [Mesoterricola silvestris]|uniref:AraC family transcriptional regulator n=2 Tax=Mesoterricola silvestris TaxID=2927979 RepID=A0AA48KAK5_9BACT|nr:AraC family transcriptional regulator [Mesoterricola silvestris]